MMTSPVVPQPYGANPRSRPAASRSGQTLDLLAGQLPHLQAQETLSSALFSTPGLGSQQLASGMPSAQFALPTMASTPMAPPMTLPPATAMSPIRVQQNFDHASFVNHDVAAAPLQVCDRIMLVDYPHMRTYHAHVCVRTGLGWSSNRCTTAWHAQPV